jgi:hypothetical protein
LLGSNKLTNRVIAIEESHSLVFGITAEQILSHLEQKAATQNSSSLPESRAPPASLFG